MDYLQSTITNNLFTIEEVRDAAALATAKEGQRLLWNQARDLANQGPCDDCSQCALKGFCVSSKRLKRSCVSSKDDKPKSGIVTAMKLQEEQQKYPGQIAYSIPRIAQIVLLTRELARKYEGKEKPIDSECYRLLRNIGKYLVELAEEKKEGYIGG